MTEAHFPLPTEVEAIDRDWLTAALQTRDKPFGDYRTTEEEG